MPSLPIWEITGKLVVVIKCIIALSMLNKPRLCSHDRNKVNDKLIELDIEYTLCSIKCQAPPQKKTKKTTTAAKGHND